VNPEADEAIGIVASSNVRNRVSTSLVLAAACSSRTKSPVAIERLVRRNVSTSEPIAERRLAKPSYQATTPGRASRCTRGTNENEPSRGSLFPLHDSERLPSDGQCSRAVLLPLCWAML
jgi:hypothetical protein